MFTTWSRVRTGGLALFVAVAMTPSAYAQAPAQVTFTKDVAPILQKSCQSCHRPGSVAPMSLLTYEDARPWARSMKQKVTAREMPPWHIDRNIGITKFKDDPSLTEAEIQTIAKWVDGGAVRGNLADMPAPKQFSDLDQWFIGKPDIVVTNEKAYTLPATGPDNIVDMLVDPGFKEDMYVMAIESKPADPQSFKVVHHFTTNLVDDPEEDPTGLFLNEYALGKNGDIFPPNSGRLIKAGIEDQLQPAPESARRRDAGQREAGPQAVPEGPGSEVRGVHAAHGRHRRSSTSRRVRSRGTTATSACRGRRSSRRSSRTCTTAARRCAWKRSIRTFARIPRARARHAPRRSAA